MNNDKSESHLGCGVQNAELEQFNQFNAEPGMRAQTNGRELSKGED